MSFGSHSSHLPSDDPAGFHRSSDSSRPSFDQYNNPYYLHHHDHAGLQLVTDRLTSGADFHAWRRSVQMALNVRNKLGFVTGTVPKPSPDHPDAGSWSRCNDMVATWLLNSVSKKIGQSLLFISTAEGIWKSLLSRFKQDDAPRVFEIEQRISSIQQGSMDVSSYYTELITLWEEYKNYVELPLCTCGKCECGIAVLWERLQERSKVTKFLMGLNDSYEQTRRHILMLKPLPNMEDAFNIVAQDERQKTIKPAISTDPAIFYAQSQENVPPEFIAAYNAFRSKRPLCTHCGLLGHTVNKCYQIYGYPPGYRAPSNSGYRPPSGPRPNVPQAPSSGMRPLQQKNYQSPRPVQSQHQNQQYYPPNGSKDPLVAQIATDSSATDGSQPTSGAASYSQEGQHMLNQITSQLGSQQLSAPVPASVTSHGVMSSLSSAGPFSGLDDW
ncbi:uncharacterized protein LOC108850113 [Raphanus sativus]|uniref:Uncharacterized protein LOC108850113 n=1 Tax=Raphanus sativus TaxID=3726 RepID=A0A9W3CU79_RAPSA|nr:uncharacterized protein LOC108850113 [Raphanus sativus]